MNTRTTKAMLATENAALRKQVADLTLDIEMLRKQQAAPAPRAQRAYTMPAWQADRAAAMAAAKAAAMRMGRVVQA